MFQYKEHLLLLTAILLFSSISTHKEPVRILALGDSITQGGNTYEHEYTYRLSLQMILHNNGIVYDFVGSQQKGLKENYTWPDVAKDVPFDADHEGYYGNTTADACRKATKGYDNYQIPPDIALIHLGTNDQKSKDFKKDVEEPLREVITFLRSKNPKITILLGHLNYNDAEAAFIIRKIVANLAIEMSSDISIIETVHHYQGWVENPEAMYTDTFDWAHPNLKGQEKMANNWWDVMEKYVYRLN